MADNPATAAPPAIDVAALTKSVTEQVTKSVIEGLKPVIAEQVKAAIPAAPAPAADKKEEAPKGVTLEDVAKLLDERDKKASTSSAISAAKAKVIKEKLNGIESLGAALPNTADEAELTKAAEALAKSINLAAPKQDAGGAATKDGGTTAVDQTIDLEKLSPTEVLRMEFEKEAAAAAKA